MFANATKLLENKCSRRWQDERVSIQFDSWYSVGISGLGIIAGEVECDAHKDRRRLSPGAVESKGACASFGKIVLSHHGK